MATQVSPMPPAVVVELDALGATLRIALERIRLAPERLALIDGTRIALLGRTTSLVVGEIDPISRRALVCPFADVVRAYRERFGREPAFDEEAYDRFVAAIERVLQRFSFATSCSCEVAPLAFDPEAASAVQTSLAATIVASILLVALIVRMFMD